MPAAAVIPAPQVYIYVAAVKKLVVGSACLASGSTFGCYWNTTQMCWFGIDALNRVSVSASEFTLKKLECLKQACAMNTLAWNNNLGLCFYFVGF